MISSGLNMGVWPLREHSTKAVFDRTLFAIIRPKRPTGEEKFFYQFILRFKQFQDDFFCKNRRTLLDVSCFVIANLSRLVAAKMRLGINCIIFA